MSSLKSILKTTPHDKKHFPATNQIHFCWFVALLSAHTPPFLPQPSSTISSTMHTDTSHPLSHPHPNCRQKYNEFVLCVKKNGGDEDACKTAYQLAASICPDEDLTTWKEQRAAGTFLGVQEHPPKETHHH